ncbi:MFS transporter [Phytomonospora endophytica]|uniref:Putative MFS family arabinose efflux permease n=1 Tax=Phytomonospora endophytica TaxID=714109 RepID=A0A841FC10_9ACTN|nr:MFS transporter [Phytomonospora endophytica]MBB6033324.1 putative MFS family arabinose efflux permease [Phytomonospora endophytica]GIG65551.1 putative transporter [Phytomonospora endophytica]
MTSVQERRPTRPPTATRAHPRLFAVMAVCSGVTVANVYLAQPLLTLFTRDLGISPSSAGLVVTCAQFGYAAGISFLVPLGDVRRRRPLLAAMLSATVIALLLAAAAPGLAPLAAAAALVGGFTVVPQVLVPLAAELAPEGRRASVVAAVQIGLMTGIIGSRVIGGAVGEVLGWRAVYVLAAVLTAASGLLTVALVPREPARTRTIGYGRLLASLPRLLRAEPALRHASLLHATLFGAYNATWTSLVLVLTREPYHFSTATAGLFGLLGLAGAVAAPWAGRFIDRRGALPIITAALLLTLASAGAYALGRSTPLLMVTAIIAVSVAVQWSQIANQARIFAYLPEARSRANTVYMGAVFLSGAICAALAGACYAAFGWPGVCTLQALLAVAGLAVLPFARRHDHRHLPATTA